MQFKELIHAHVEHLGDAERQQRRRHVIAFFNGQDRLPPDVDLIGQSLLAQVQSRPMLLDVVPEFHRRTRLFHDIYTVHIVLYSEHYVKKK